MKNPNPDPVNPAGRTGTPQVPSQRTPEPALKRPLHAAIAPKSVTPQVRDVVKTRTPTGEVPAPGQRPGKATPDATPPTPPFPPMPDPTTPVPDRPPAEAPPETDRPLQLPTPKGTIRPPKPGAPGKFARAKDEAGKVGLAILMWLLGVPGGLILLYLIFWH